MRLPLHFRLIVILMAFFCITLVAVRVISVQNSGYCTLWVNPNSAFSSVIDINSGATYGYINRLPIDDDLWSGIDGYRVYTSSDNQYQAFYDDSYTYTVSLMVRPTHSIASHLGTVI